MPCAPRLPRIHGMCTKGTSVALGRLRNLDGPTWQRWAVAFCVAGIFWLDVGAFALMEGADYMHAGLAGFSVFELMALIISFNAFMLRCQNAGKTLAVAALILMAGACAFNPIH